MCLTNPELKRGFIVYLSLSQNSKMLTFRNMNTVIKTVNNVIRQLSGRQAGVLNSLCGALHEIRARSGSSSILRLFNFVCTYTHTIHILARTLNLRGYPIRPVQNYGGLCAMRWTLTVG